MGQEAAPIASVPLSNEWSNRPTEAFLHIQVLPEGGTKLWITGMSISNYESLVGPERAQRHRDSFDMTPQRKGFIRRLIDRI